MKFGNAAIAYMLWLVVLMGIFYIWAFRKKRKILESLAAGSVLVEITSSVDLQKEAFKAFLTVTAVFLIIVSLMRPQWGFTWEEVRKKGLDILIAIDTSKSMLAEDVKPTRLERSKLAVKDLIKRLTGDRIGLIAFSGSAFLQCPLTTDYNGFILSLNDLAVDTIPRGGTAIANAIWEAISVYRGEAQAEKTLIIITDGEDHEGDPVNAAEMARRKNIKVFCVGIGTTEGELIPLEDDRRHRVFLKDREGNVVKTRLDEPTLEKIALATGGSYVRATGAEFGLDYLYSKTLSKMEKTAFEDKLTRRYKERFQAPLALAVLLLISEMLIGERKKTA
jgi:Ca-activated chloride channel homolog